MSVFVLDCSVASAWLFEDEATAETDALLDQLANGAALVPLHWRFELGNVLVQAERRGRITPAQVAASVELVNRHALVPRGARPRSFDELDHLRRRLFGARFTERIAPGDARQGAGSGRSRLEGNDAASLELMGRTKPSQCR